MKPLFVSIHEGRRDVHWVKLSIGCAAVLVLSSLAALGVWYALTHTMSLAALLAGFVLGVTVVARIVARAITLQVQEIELESPVTSG